ncbi:MAG: hypothetical protein ACHQM6_05040 [Candidatus Kapaibacterium sp.]
MRTTIGILVCLALISCEHIYAPNEDQPGNFKQLRQEAYPNPDSTFNVKNDTQDDVGSVIIHLVDSSNVNINVPDSGYFSANISAAPTACTVNGFPLLYSTPTWISISSHTSVHATWTSNVIVIDESEVN